MLPHIGVISGADKGIILCRAETPEAARAILEEDPFYCRGIADYTVTEFIPSKFAAGFACFAEA